MIKYEKLTNNNINVEILQSQGWSVLGEVVGPNETFVKMTKTDQEYSKRLSEANQTDHPLLELALTDDVLEIKSDPNNPKLAILFKGFKEKGITVKQIE